MKLAPINHHFGSPVIGHEHHTRMVKRLRNKESIKFTDETNRTLLHEIKSGTLCQFTLEQLVNEKFLEDTEKADQPVTDPPVDTIHLHTRACSCKDYVITIQNPKDPVTWGQLMTAWREFYTTPIDQMPKVKKFLVDPNSHLSSDVTPMGHTVIDSVKTQCVGELRVVSITPGVAVIFVHVLL